MEIQRQVINGFLGFLFTYTALPLRGISSQNSVVVRDYALVNGLKMYYEIHGSGKPLVLIHGGGSTIDTTFGRVLPAFARNRKVIAVELQGHGHTADRDAPLSFEQDADDVAALLHCLHIQQADFFGFSNGGNTALQMGIRHPELVDKLVIGSAFFRVDDLHAPIRESFSHNSADNMPEVLREAYLQAAPRPEKLQELVPKLMKRILEMKDLKSSDLRKVNRPVLLLAGNQDVTALEHYVANCALFPQAELVVLPGAHGTYIGEVLAAVEGSPLPELTVLQIEAFLNKV